LRRPLLAGSGLRVDTVIQACMIGRIMFSFVCRSHRRSVLDRRFSTFTFQTRIVRVQVNSDCSASSRLGTTPPPVPPFLRNARGGKTREALSRRGFYGDQALKLLRRSPKTTSSRVFSRSKHSAPARLGKGGMGPLTRVSGGGGVSTYHARSYKSEQTRERVRKIEFDAEK